jgi:hypothetical protein
LSAETDLGREGSATCSAAIAGRPMNDHGSKLEPTGRDVIRRVFLRPAWLAALLLLAGCAGVQPPPPTVATADIGPAPTGYEAPVRAYFAPQLKDPYSAVYQFEAPVQAFGQHAIWAVCGTINAKNSFGEYVGAKPFIVLFFPNGDVKGAIDTHEYKTRVSPAVEKCAEWRAASPDAASPAASPPSWKHSEPWLKTTPGGMF